MAHFFYSDSFQKRFKDDLKQLIKRNNEERFEESACLGFWCAQDRPGRRVRLLRFAGAESLARRRHQLRAGEPQHRHHPDFRRHRRPGVLPAGDPLFCGTDYQEGAPRRHPAGLRRTDGAQLRHGTLSERRTPAVWRARPGYLRGGHHEHRRPRPLREEARRNPDEDPQEPCRGEYEGCPRGCPRDRLSRHGAFGLCPGRAGQRHLSRRGIVPEAGRELVHLLQADSGGRIAQGLEGD